MKNKLAKNSIFRKTAGKRMLFFLIGDVFLVSFSFYVAFLLRFEGQIPEHYFNGNIQAVIILAVIICIIIFYLSRLYYFTWAYVSTQELISLFKAVTLSFLSLGAALFILRDHEILQGFPRSVLVISYFLVFISTGLTRFSKRIYLSVSSGKNETKGKRRTLIVGAGDAGEQILRSITVSKNNFYNPVGFIDDNQIKQNVMIHGLKVIGKIDDIDYIIKKEDIEEMIIALPSAGSDIIKKAVSLGRKAEIKSIKILPSISELIDGRVTVGNIREIQVEDLLGREAISIDTDRIEKFIKGKSVLITGAAGSIGSELSRQIAKFKPSQLFILDQEESGMFFIFNELRSNFHNVKITSIIADIRDKKRMGHIFDNIKPNIVFHAAAYKHVSLMEENPVEAVKNNVFGMRNIAEESLKNGVEKFIFISTDKAINPTSVMGATKRIGEMICETMNKKGKTKYISVRFGNVLGSRGSVIPIFKEQIKKGGPVTVTHPDMKRYFMVTSEACILVMQAAEMGGGGEVFVLDMGEPVKIIDLAREIIKLSGFEPDKDIPIVFTGAKRGEKMFEEILTAEEGVVATKNQKIFIAKLSSVDTGKLNLHLSSLEENVDKSDERKIKALFKKLITSYSDREA